MITRYRPMIAACASLAMMLVAVAIPDLSPSSAAPSPARVVPGDRLTIVAPKLACSDLAKTDMAAIAGPGSRIVAAAETTDAHRHTVCAVTGTLAPTIGFRVELPTRTWTQRYLQVGCGGLCGNVALDIAAADGCPQVDATGFVVASTDMGHAGRDGAFGLDPQKRVDFAYRGVHLTALAAKALIRAYYGQAERYAYFDGCSDGGREALVEAQRFPQDFNGIVAGAPAMNFVVQNSLFHAWQARSNSGADGKPILLAARLPILHAAVLRACDAFDGKADGIVSMPSRCTFDPGSIVCRAAQSAAQCLTPAEAAVAKRFYDGPRDPRSGERLTLGGPQLGSELQWVGIYVPRSADQPLFSAMIANDAMGTLIFPTGRPATVQQVVFDRPTFDALRARQPLFDATDPDLAAFAGRGGKLILYHGWADPHISPINTIAYHDAVRRQLGAARADAFERLYLMPGMGHCAGGEGPSAFDLLSPVMAWVEHGTAPDAIVTRTLLPGAGGPGGKGPGGPRPGAEPGKPAPAMGPPPGLMPAGPAGPPRSRPVYPYPYVAAYAGHGDADLAVNWVRGAAVVVTVPAWAGTDFYTPYAGPTG